MATVEELTSKLRDALSRQPVASSLKVDLGEAGVIRAEGFEVTNEDRDAACTLVLAKADLDAVLAGHLDPVVLMNDGRMQLQGDPAAAMAMQPVLFAAWL
ncbi:MAG: SCP2 sterol-binding domain-containing protein [Sphingomonas adhaesiva]|uniref:SCP2 sterol-binding domain-containing protein n=1 Tax=Sphingomonas adhaesiva TaxID=28212 RepID=UPI002FFB600E